MNQWLRRIVATVGLLTMSGLVASAADQVVPGAAQASSSANPSPMAAGGAAVPSPAQPPNVIIIAIDTLRRDHLGCYGYDRPTSPRIDAFAAQGVLFERCYSAAAWTMPNFMAIFTGLLPASHGCMEPASRLPDAAPTLAEKFKERGYFCGAVLMNPTLRPKYGLARGFDRYDDYSVELAASAAATVMPAANVEGIEQLVTSAIVTRQTRAMIEAGRQTGKPLFIFALYFDPHYDYAPLPPYDKKFDADYTGAVTGKNLFFAWRNRPPGARDVQHLIGLYDGEIAYTDQEVGKLIEFIDTLGRPSDTLTILVSDHGTAFYEHGTLLHNSSVYREEVAVPMIWRWPGILPAGRRVKEVVANFDIARTLKELLRFRKFDLVQGRSLWPALLGGPLADAQPVFSERCSGANRHVALTQGDLRLHARFVKSLDEPGATLELYDLGKDPQEKQNLLSAAPPELPALKARLAAAVAECREIHDYLYPDGQQAEVELTAEERRVLESLGYIGGGAKTRK